jgi:DNA-binding SARP family transcriptional activator
MLSIHLLGVFSITHNGQRINDQLGPSGRQLAGFLFHFNGRAHRRERLADLFWRQLDPDSARAALNTALWRLRKILALEPCGQNSLRPHGSDISLELGPWVLVDTQGLSAALHKILNSQDRDIGVGRLRALEAAIADYSGPFMDGDDADWILEERERLHSLFVRGVMECVRMCGLLGHYEDAIVAARRILSVDPFRESIVRNLMILFILNGQRGEALRYIERWRVHFRRELGVDPMPDTTRLAEEIRSGEIFQRLTALKATYFLGVGHEDAQFENGFEPDLLRFAN